MGNKGITIDFNSLLHWNIIEYAYPSLWHEIKENTQILFLLKEHISALEERLGERTMREISDEDLKDVPRSLWEHIKNKDLVETVKNFSGNEGDIRVLISLREIFDLAFCKISSII